MTTMREIADKLGLHFTTVSQRAKFLGLPSRLHRKGKRKPFVDGKAFDPAYYARHARIPDDGPPASAAEITAALMGDPGHGPSVTVQRAGRQQKGGEPI